MIEIWHNPRCSKSRQALKLLEERGFKPTVIRYLETPPTKERLLDVLKCLALEPREVMRSREVIYSTLSLGDDTLDENALIEAMAAHPILIERPVIIIGDRAVIGRPPERVLELLD